MGPDLFDKKPKKTPNHTGHHQRLCARFLRTMGEGMPDYELLELLLILAIPRRDVKPLAKDLIDQFWRFRRCRKRRRLWCWCHFHVREAAG